MLGVFARISRDEGLTWGAPRVLFNTTVRRANTRPGGVDGGYPSSVQLKDGTIVTAYSASGSPCTSATTWAWSGGGSHRRAGAAFLPPVEWRAVFSWLIRTA